MNTVLYCCRGASPLYIAWEGNQRIPGGLEEVTIISLLRFRRKPFRPHQDSHHL